MSSLSSRAEVEIEPVEAKARYLQQSVWNERHALYPGVVPENPVELLEPGLALRLLGFRIIPDSTLGEMIDNGRRTKVAGLISWSDKSVRIANTFSAEEQRFTAAHELAHAVLHPGVNGLHRDKVVSGPMFRKDPKEYEADRFASCFLMPARLVRRRFEAAFRRTSMTLDEDTLFGLRIPSFEHAIRRIRCLRDLSMTLASANTFNGASFDSLARYFRVSPTAMAIRLEELDLVTWMPEREAEPSFW